MAPVTLRLDYAGGDSAGAPGRNAGLEHEFALSGRTSYTVTDSITALRYCYTRYVGVSADLASNTAVAAFRRLATPSCS